MCMAGVAASEQRRTRRSFGRRGSLVAAPVLFALSRNLLGLFVELTHQICLHMLMALCVRSIARNDLPAHFMHANCPSPISLSMLTARTSMLSYVLCSASATTLADEAAALKAAFKLAAALGRIVILPEFHCHGCAVAGLGGTKAGCAGTCSPMAIQICFGHITSNYIKSNHIKCLFALCFGRLTKPRTISIVTTSCCEQTLSLRRALQSSIDTIPQNA